jgi:hypothetical protein
VNCPNCGTSNLDNASICVNCGRAMAGGGSYTPPPPPPQQQASYTPPPPRFDTPGQPPGMPPPNYLWQSIVVTLCCCLPLGIVAIIFAAQVNDKFRRGDIQGAMQASKQAKMWMLIAFGLGLLVILIYGIFGGAAFMEAVREAQANR